MSVLATCLGYPRIGADRELKKALEGYWSQTTHLRESSSRDGARASTPPLDGHEGGASTTSRATTSRLYDHMLDTAVMVGAVPARYRAIADPLARYFAMARGLQDPGAGIDVPALEMTKWFDTNYHYIVPELAARTDVHARRRRSSSPRSTRRARSGSSRGRCSSGP